MSRCCVVRLLGYLTWCNGRYLEVLTDDERWNMLKFEIQISMSPCHYKIKYFIILNSDLIKLYFYFTIVICYFCMMDNNDCYSMAIIATIILFPKIPVPQKIRAGISLITTNNSFYVGPLYTLLLLLKRSSKFLVKEIWLLCAWHLICAWPLVNPNDFKGIC